MKSLTANITEKVKEAFKKCGYDVNTVIVVPSKQLGIDYQCNSAFEVAKRYGKDPMEVAEQVSKVLCEI